MSHRVYAGPFAALEMHLLSRIASIKAGDPAARVVVLLGSNILASYLKRRLVECMGGAVNVLFCTFPDVIARLNAGSAPKQPLLPRLGPSLVIERLVLAHTPTCFAEVAGYRGFRDALLESFRDLRDAGVTAALLNRAVDELAPVFPERQAELEGFASLYRRFRDSIERFHAVDQDFRDAVRNAVHADRLLGCTELFVYGLYDVTGQQSDLLAALKDTLSMTYYVPGASAAARFAEQFVDDRARELGVTPERLEGESPGGLLGEVWERQFGFGAAAGGALSDDGSLALVSAPGDSRMAVEVVREVLRAGRDGVIAGFSDAAVVLRQPERDLHIISEALRLRSIPFFADTGTSLGDRPLSRAALAVARLEEEEFEREAVLRCMDLIAASLPPEAQGAWDVAGWRALTNDPAFLSGLSGWNEGLPGLVRRCRAELAEGFAAIPDSDDEGGFANLDAARRKLESAASLSAAWQQVRSAALGWPVQAAARVWAEFLQTRLKPLFEPSEDWPLFESVFEEIAQLGCFRDVPGIGARISRREVIGLLEECLGWLSHPQGRLQASGVNLLSIAAARGLRFPLVIVPGLDEGSFPAPLRQDPLLLDDERRRMRPARLPLKSRRGEEEMLLFDIAVRAAQRRLVLLTSRLDENSDRERLPSDYFLRVAGTVCGKPVAFQDLVPGRVSALRSVGLDNPSPDAGQVPVDATEIRLRFITRSGISPNAALEVLAQAEPGRVAAPYRYLKSRTSVAMTEYDGLIADPQLRRRVFADHGPPGGPMSASRLEEYARCPYLFFLRRIVGVAAWEEPRAALSADAMERGRVVHEVLERYVERCPDALSSAPLAAAEAELTAGVLRQLEEWRPAGMPELLWEIERDAIVHMLRNWLLFERERGTSGLRPFALERSFGGLRSGDGPPLLVRTARHSIAFRGKIDRIDLSSDGTEARIVDYKVGSLPAALGRRPRSVLMGGEKLQLAVYTRTIRSVAGCETVRSAGAEYLYLQPRTGAAHSCAYSPSELEQAAAHLPDVLDSLVEAMESGNFGARARGAVRPEGHCESCDFLPICGKDRESRERLKAADPVNLPLRRLRESVFREE